MLCYFMLFPMGFIPKSWELGYDGYENMQNNKRESFDTNYKKFISTMNFSGNDDLFMKSFKKDIDIANAVAAVNNKDS